MNEPWEMTEFRATPQQSSFEFLKADLALCAKFADLVETELTRHDGSAEQVLAKAEEGYAAIPRLFVQLRGRRQRSEIRRGLQELRIRLDNLKARVREQRTRAT
jgi:hypothetical protein